jgi:hypothetical protein
VSPRLALASKVPTILIVWRYAEMGGTVRPNVSRLTDADARHLLADGLIRTCHLAGGPSRVGLEIGCDEKTVRRARDEESTLGLACAWNLLDVNEHALDSLAAAKGFRLARLSSVEAPDVIAAGGAVIHKIAVARQRNSPGGTRETDDELIAAEGDLAQLEEAASALRARIVAAKLRRARA